MRRLALSLILILAFFLRVLWIDRYPVGFTPDEASFGYDAYSLLKTGQDQWGKSWPLTFRSFGDSKLPLYTYLTIPSVAIFGLNEFATRLPSALIGVLAVFVTYLMAKELFKNKGLAYLSAFLLAISPWHMALSRGAFEANLTVFFMPLGVWAFYRGLKNKQWFVLSAVALGLNLFTYHSARLITPLLVAFLIFWNREELGIESLEKAVRKYFLPGLIFAGFLGLGIYSFFAGGSSRAADITIFNPTDKWMAAFDRRYEAVFNGLPYFLARVFSNKIVYLFDTFTNAYSTYLSPQFLFTLGPGEWTYGMIAGRGVLYLFEVPFVLASLWFLAKYGLRQSKALTFIFIWILIGSLPGALTKGPGYAANRAAVMMPAITAFSAYGAMLLYEKVSWLKKKLLRVFFILFALIFLSIFLEDYFYHSPWEAAGPMLYGRREAFTFIKGIAGSYKEIVVSRSISEPQIYVAFYGKVDPKEFQRSSVDWERYKEAGLPFLDQLGKYRLGKYTFRSIHYNEDIKEHDILLVGKPDEFPEGIKPLYTVNFPNGKPALIIIESSGPLIAR